MVSRHPIALTDQTLPESYFGPDDDEVQSYQSQGKGWTTFALIISVVLWLWAIIDVCTRRFADVNRKIAWVVAILLCGGIGSLLYLIFGRGASSSIGKSTGH